MASNYERRITLYINGQAVKNDVKSIRAEMNKLVNEQSRMIINSKEYLAHASKIRQLKGILAEHNEQVKAVSKSWNLREMGRAFNDYFAMVAATVAGLTGIVMGMKKVVQSFNDFEERVDNLSALTGLAGEDLDWLSQKAKDLSVSTLESGIRVTQGAQQIVDAFTKVGSARPELLKDKEALVQVTEEAIILSNAAKTELQPAIEALTMVMNQYNVPASEARRIINALGAGSKEGAGEIPYLTTAFEKAGTVAADAGLSIETLVATIETLAPRITQPEIAGRSLKGVLLDLQNSTDDVNPAIVGMATALENLGKKNLSVTQLTKMFGTENITTAKILINNVGELKKYEAAVTGTNVAIEQAAINTDNNNAKLAQAKNRLALISIELGEKLAPSLTFSTNSLTYMIKALMSLIGFFREYGRLIVTATSALVGYAVAVKVAAMWQARHNTAAGLGLVITKLKVFWHNAERGALLLAAAAQALYTGNVGRATAAMRLFNTVTKLNPFGLLIGLITAAGTALYLYSKKLTAVQQAQKLNNDINVTAQKNMVEEKLRIQQLLELARDEMMSKQVRLAAIKQLNEISPRYLGFLSLENINTEEATKSVAKYIEMLLQKAKVQAAQEKLVEIEKERLDELASGADKEIGFMRTLWIAATSGKNMLTVARRAEKVATENAAKATEDYLAKVKAVTDITGKYSFLVNNDTPDPAGNANGNDDGTTTSGLTADEILDMEKERKKRAEKLREFFALDSEEQKDAIKAELYKLGKEGAAALAKGIEDERKAAQENFDLLSEIVPEEKDKKDVAGDYALQQYYETLEGKKTLLMAQHEAELISEQEFQDKMLKLVKEAEDEKLQKKIDNMERANAVTYAAANFVGAMMEMELQEAGDNEEKKHRIRKKYADAQMVVSIGQIITNTAVAVMKTLAELGPIAGPVAAAFISATGMVELGMAVNERNRMKALYAGGYTGGDDKYKPAGIVHEGEYVIPQEGVSNPKLRPLIEMFETARKNNALARLDLRPEAQKITMNQGFAQGGYTSPQSVIASAAKQPVIPGSDPELLAALTKLNQHLEKGIKASINKYGTNGLDESLRDIDAFNTKNIQEMKRAMKKTFNKQQDYQHGDTDSYRYHVAIKKTNHKHMKLTVGSQRIALPVDSSISIEKSSPFLNGNTASFSYPFPVPTQPNQRILGWPGELKRVGDLPDTSFVLEDAGLQILRGEVEYDTITASQIGIILKAGNTLFASKIDGKYLSDIDYGRESWLNNDYTSTQVRNKIAEWDAANTTDNGKYVAAPALINPFREDVPMYVNKINKDTGNLVYDPQYLIQQQLFMLQFRAYFILEKIFEFTGYTILLNDLKTCQFKDLIIFSNIINLPITFNSPDLLTYYLEYSSLMPKVTVKDFMDSISKLLCLTYDIDEKFKTVRIVFTKDLFAAGNTDQLQLVELAGWEHTEKKPSGGFTLSYQSQDDDKDTFSNFPAYVETITEMTLPTPTTDGKIVRVQFSDYYYITEKNDSVYSWRWIGRLRDKVFGNGAEKIELSLKIPKAVTNADGYVYPKLEITPTLEGNNPAGVQRISFDPISELIVSIYHGRKQISTTAWIPYSSGDRWGINGGWIKEASVWLSPEFLFDHIYSDYMNWKALRARSFTKYLKLSLPQLLQIQWGKKYRINGVQIILDKINYEIPHKGTVKIHGFTA